MENSQYKEDIKKTIGHNKVLLRKRLLNLLISMGKDIRSTKSDIINKKLQEIQEYKQAKTVMLFWPMETEPDLKKVIFAAQKEGKKIALPCVSGKEIKPYLFESQEFMQKNDLGVYEPKEELSKRVDIKDVDVIVVPALAYDDKGHRLGRGGGYYDRFLTHLSNAYKIGVCFDFQLLQDLPFDPSFDQAVDVIISG